MRTFTARWNATKRSTRRLDKEIVRVEQGLEHRTDEELETLKMQRVRLKDDLYEQLRK